MNTTASNDGNSKDYLENSSLLNDNGHAVASNFVGKSAANPPLYADPLSPPTVGSSPIASSPVGSEGNPLDQLPPLALPDPVGWWPLAPGWWFVGLMALALTAILLRFVYRYRQSKKLQRAAVTEAKSLYHHYQSTHDGLQYLLQTNQLLRRFCLQQFPALNCASINGTQWLERLDQLAKKTLFQSTAGQQLIDIYQPNPSIDIEILHPLILKWLHGVNLKQEKHMLASTKGTDPSIDSTFLQQRSAHD